MDPTHCLQGEAAERTLAFLARHLKAEAVASR
jgi:hypothetical protein